jgi:hypothetical protein
MRVNPRNMKLLEDALKAADRKTKWAAGEAQAKAMHQICRSGAAAVKPRSMRAKRNVIPNPDRTGRGRNAKGAKYAIEILRQGKAPYLCKTNDKSPRNPKRIIRKLGLAATAFRIASGAFGAALRGEKVRTKSKLVDTTLQKGRLKARLEVFLSYLEEAKPGWVDRAMKKGLTSFIRSFDRDWASAIKESRY